MGLRQRQSQQSSHGEIHHTCQVGFSLQPGLSAHCAAGGAAPLTGRAAGRAAEGAAPLTGCAAGGAGGASAPEVRQVTGGALLLMPCREGELRTGSSV